MNKYNLLLVLVVASIVLNCSGSKKLVTAEKLKKQPTAQSLLTYLSDKEVQSEWFTAKAKLHYEDDVQTLNASLTLRMKTDSVIWMSIKKYGVEAARIKIVPDSILVINRIEKQYAIIPMSYVEKQYNIPASFENLESLVRGGIPFESSTLRTLNIQENSYLLSSEDGQASTSIGVDKEELLLEHLKMRSDDKLLNISLENYAELSDQQIFSYLRRIEILSKTLGQISCYLNFSKVDFSIPKNIKFDIPEKYTPMEF